MGNSLLAVAIDCGDAPALAQLCADVLGRGVAEDSASEHVVLLVSDGGTSGSPSPTWKATNSASPLAEQHRNARRLISSGWEHTPASGWCLLRGAFRRRDRHDHL